MRKENIPITNSPKGLFFYASLHFVTLHKIKIKSHHTRPAHAREGEKVTKQQYSGRILRFFRIDAIVSKRNETKMNAASDGTVKEIINMTKAEKYNELIK